LLPYKEWLERIMSGSSEPLYIREELEIDNLSGSRKKAAGVRITHTPTGISAVGEGGRNTSKNRSLAQKSLRSRLAKEASIWWEYGRESGEDPLDIFT